MPRRFILGVGPIIMCSAVREADGWGLQETGGRAGRDGKCEWTRMVLRDVGNRCDGGLPTPEVVVTFEPHLLRRW